MAVVGLVLEPGIVLIDNRYFMLVFLVVAGQPRRAGPLLHFVKV